MYFRVPGVSPSIDPPSTRPWGRSETGRPFVSWKFAATRAERLPESLGEVAGWELIGRFEQRQRVRRLRGEGMTIGDVGREVGCSLRTVMRVMAGTGTREERQSRWCPGARRLSLADREEVSLGLRRGEDLPAAPRGMGGPATPPARARAAHRRL